jgi:hypothetical protein
MKDRTKLEVKAKKLLESRNYSVERAKVSAKIVHGHFIRNRNDFFGIFDLIAVRGDECRFIQITSGSRQNIYAHKRKIDEAFKDSFKGSHCELWFYEMLKHRWHLSIFHRTDNGWLTDEEFKNR